MTSDNISCAARPLRQVAAIIPVAKNEKFEHLRRTVESLAETSRLRLEVVPVFDGFDGWDLSPAADGERVKIRPLRLGRHEGERVAINRAVAASEAEYIFRVDAHCSMTFAWDVLLSSVAQDRRTLAFGRIDALDERSWRGIGQAAGLVYLTAGMEEKWLPGGGQSLAFRTPSMTLTGCGWMVHRKCYEKIGGFDEGLGTWGAEGAELSMKVWGGGGRIELVRDVVCGHVYDTGKGVRRYNCDVAAARKTLLDRYGPLLCDLAERFRPLPGWHDKGAAI